MNISFQIREIKNGFVFSWYDQYVCGSEQNNELFYNNLDEVYETLQANVVRAVETMRANYSKMQSQQVLGASTAVGSRMQDAYEQVQGEDEKPYERYRDKHPDPYEPVTETFHTSGGTGQPDTDEMAPVAGEERSQADRARDIPAFLTRGARNVDADELDPQDIVND